MGLLLAGWPYVKGALQAASLVSTHDRFRLGLQMTVWACDMLVTTATALRSRARDRARIG